MSGRSEWVRREIQDSGSPLVSHSMNQEKTRLGRQGEEKVDGVSGRSRKVLRARVRREGMQESTIAPKGTIFFAEDLGLGR